MGLSAETPDLSSARAAVCQTLFRHETSYLRLALVFSLSCFLVNLFQAMIFFFLQVLLWLHFTGLVAQCENNLVSLLIKSVMHFLNAF